MADNYQEGDRYQTADGQILVLKGSQWVPENQPAWVDALKSVPGGLVKGGVSLLTTPFSMADLAARGIDLAAGKFLPESVSGPIHRGAEYAEQQLAPGTYEGGMKQLEKDFGPLYQPQTTAGRIVQGIGEYAPLMAGGEGSLAAKLGRGLLRGTAASGSAEGASQAAQAAGVDPAYDPLVRAIGGMGGYAVPSILRKAVTPFPTPGAEGALRRQQTGVLRQHGVDVPASQATGSPRVAAWEGRGGQAPTGQAQQVTQAMLGKMGIDAPLATRSVVAQGKKAIGTRLDQLEQTAHLPFGYHDPLNVELAQIGQNTTASGPLWDGIQKIYAARRGNFLTGKDYRTLRGEMYSDPATRQLGAVLDKHMDAAHPGVWPEARSQYSAAEAIGAGTNSGILNPSKVFNATADRAPTGNLAELSGAAANVTKPIKPMQPSGDIPSLVGALMMGGAGLGRALSSGAAAVEAIDPFVGSILGGEMGPRVANVARRYMAEPLARSKAGQAYLGNQLWQPGPYSTMTPAQAAAVLGSPAVGLPQLAPPRITIPLSPQNVTPEVAPPISQ